MKSISAFVALAPFLIGLFTRPAAASDDLGAPPVIFASDTMFDENDIFGDPDFSLGIGYGNFSVGGSDSPLDGLDMLRFDAATSIGPLPNLPQLRIGAALGFGFVLDSSGFFIISDGGIAAGASGDVPMIVFEPELRVSWRQYLGGGAFFLEPGVGLGGAIANISIDADDTSTGEDFDEWDSTFTGRAFLNLGFEVEGGFAGFQISYMRGDDLDFGTEASGDVEEFYVGIFGALRF